MRRVVGGGEECVVERGIWVGRGGCGEEDGGKGKEVVSVWIRGMGPGL